MSNAFELNDPEYSSRLCLTLLNSLRRFEPWRFSRAGIVIAGLSVALLLISRVAYSQTDDSNADTGEFLLRIVGPAGETVPNARIEIRPQSVVSKEQILSGSFEHQEGYGTLVTADSNGNLRVAITGNPSRISFNIQHAGFGPYWAEWNLRSLQALPPEFIVELDAAWSAGGIIVDENGNPIANAVVRPNLQYKKRPGDSSALGIGTKVRTDAQGHWRFDNVPDSQDYIFVEINHPDFKPLRQKLARDGFEIAAADAPSAQIVLEQGLTVTGTVTDEAGQAVEGATIRTEFLNDLREGITDGNGVYRLAGCEPALARIVVFAKGKALDLQEVRVAQDMEPVDFKMKPGGQICVRVVDEEGKGIARARIFFQRWRGRIDYFEFDHVDQYTNEDGIWEWDEAPPDEFQADISAPGRMGMSEQPLIARDEEFVFRPPPLLVITGRVKDAATGEIVPEFRVIPGLRNSDPLIGFNWIPGDSYDATDGSYTVAFSHDYTTHLVRIEAEGYQVAISRDIRSDEGSVEFDFELELAEDIRATVYSPDGEPASSAQVAVGVAGSRISLDNGEIDDGSTNATRVVTDEEGEFSVPARTEPFQIVVTHPDGFAHVKSVDGRIPHEIDLTGWARVEGTFRVGDQVMSRVAITASGSEIHSYGPDVPSIFTHYDTVTGDDGGYSFDRMVPGTGRIGRRILLTVDDGATEVTSAMWVSGRFVSGDTTQLDIGGTGCAVIGTLVPPDGFTGKPLWNFAMIDVRGDIKPPRQPDPPAGVGNDRDAVRAWRSEWKKTPVGQAWEAAYAAYEEMRAAYPSIHATVGRDGSFRIDDVPPGYYVLNVERDQRAPGGLSRHLFEISEDDSGNPEPLNLGMLQLEP